MIILKIEQQDYLNAQSLHYRRSKRGGIVFILLAICAVVVVLSWMPWDIRAWLGAGLVLSILLACAITGLFTRLVYIPWKAKRIFRQQKSLHRETTLSWDTDALHSKSAVGESFLPWSDFIRWKENEHLFLLYFSDMLFYIVPKRAFSDDEEIKSFRENLSRNVPA